MLTKIIARGHGPFPLDMLRFHNAWPAAGCDAAVMQASMDENGKNKHTIALHTAIPPHEHSMLRWASFGWSARIECSLTESGDCEALSA